MQSGKRTLSSLDQSLKQLRGELLRVEARVKESSEALVSLRKEQAGRFRRIAEIRLDHVISGELAGSLEAADKRAAELIRQRGQKLAALTRQLKASQQAQAALEERRAGAAEETARAMEQLDRAEATTQGRLADDSEYQSQLERSREAERTAEHALEKTRQARVVRREKGAPYESDPLFMYLWNRHYGTVRYAANSLVRWLDDWVADLCDYAGARPNYASLLEIPERLAEHAERLRDRADDQFIALAAIEVREAERDGAPELKGALDAAEAGLEEIDREISAAENRTHDLSQQRARFASGEDADFQSAIDTLHDALEQESLYSLFEYARATATDEDDVLVQDLEQARSQLRSARDFVSDRKRSRDRLVERMRELEDLRRKFKHKRYDGVHSEFRNTGALDMTLEQFLVGTATAQELWRTIEAGQRYRRIRSDPRFGTGGFRRRPGTWHRPFPRGGGGGGGIGGGGGFGSGGGGFRTGGGF